MTDTQEINEVLKRSRDILEDEVNYAIVQEINQVLGED